MRKVRLWLWGRQTYNFWNSVFLIFPTFKQLLSRVLWKNFQVSKYILKVLINFYCFTNICDLKFLDNETTTLWIFFEIARKSVWLLKFWQIREILTPQSCWYFYNVLLWVILMENESFTGRLFSNYGSLNMLFHFFRYLIYSVFHETFVKKFMKKLSFFSSNFKKPFQDAVYYRK